MKNYQHELWVDGECFKITNYHYNANLELDALDAPKDMPITTLELTLPFTTITPEDVKDWMTDGQLVKNLDVLIYKKKELLRHFRLFEGRCTQYRKYYDNDLDGMYIELFISPTYSKIEPII